MLAKAALLGALLSACTVQPRLETSDAQPEQVSILAGSTPANGSTVMEPVDKLVLRFVPPARLDEVTISGPDGTMPMMVHSVGEATDYSLPLPELGAGDYTVNWQASAQGRQHIGSFQFVVK